MEWIKCTDRLPETKERVLVYYFEDDYFTCGYFETYEQKGWVTEMKWIPKGNETHWMPFPDPPKDI